MKWQRSINLPRGSSRPCRTSIIHSTTRSSWYALRPHQPGAQKQINFSTVSAGEAVGIKEVQDDIWLVSSMEYGLGNGGEGGIRTHDTVPRMLAFEASTFNHSVTSPQWSVNVV